MSCESRESRTHLARFGVCAFALVLLVALPALGQEADHRPLSPRGQASTQVGGSWVKQDNGRTSYQDGKWIDIDYGRPILRGRTDIFGSGADYGKGVDSGASVWRAGANQTTRIKTEAPLVIGGKTLQPGGYSLFVELSEGPKWTFVVSSQPYQEKYDRNNKEATWGAYGYDSKYDVVRAPMTLETSPHSIDQFSIGFGDVTDQGGKIFMGWDHTVATVDFQLAK